MRINVVKMALAEVQKICKKQKFCNPTCPFYVEELHDCPMGNNSFPENWQLRLLREDVKDDEN